MHFKLFPFADFFFTDFILLFFVKEGFESKDISLQGYKE